MSVKYLGLLATHALALYYKSDYYANAVITKDISGTKKVSGRLDIYQNDSRPAVFVLNLSGLPTTSVNGWHIHENPIIANNCTTAGSHFNPQSVNHGGHDARVRHYGDFGNIRSDKGAVKDMKYTDLYANLNGPFNIFGRAIVIHEKQDDLGLINNEGSRTTGNAGARLACGTISRSFQHQTPKEIQDIIDKHIKTLDDKNVYQSAVPKGQIVLKAGYTIGKNNYQVYKCDSTLGKYVFSYSEAELEDDMRHYFQNGKASWEFQMVLFQSKSLKGIPNRLGNSKNIAWLVTQASHNSAPGGPTVMTILRTATSGGVFNENCRAGDPLKFIPYNALYTFYGIL